MKKKKPEKEQEMLSARQFAKRANVAYPTVMKWLREGIVPGAQFVEDGRFGPYWDIPADSVGKVIKRKPGPKPADVTAKVDEAVPSDAETKPKPSKKLTTKRRGN